MGRQTAASPDDVQPGEAAGTVPAASTGSVESTPGATDVSTLGATLLSEEPEVQQHAVEQARAEAESQKDADVNGEGFNPAIHAVNADGSPRKTVGGAWAKKRGNKGGAAAKPTTSAKVNIPGQPGQPTQSEAKEQLARNGGKGAANLLMAVCVGLMGAEWQPVRDEKIGRDDKAMLESVFGDYFVATGKADLPPGWALAAGLTMYALPRFAMPQTRSRMSRVKDWFGAKYVQWRARRAGMRVTVKTKAQADMVSADLDSRETMRAAAGQA